MPPSKRLFAIAFAASLLMTCGPNSATTPNNQTVIVIMKDSDGVYSPRYEGELLEWDDNYMVVRTADTITTIIPTGNVGAVYVHDQ